MRMKMRTVALGAWVVTMATWASAQDRPLPQGGAALMASATARVDKIDLEKRELTLRDDQGKTFSMKVPESVRRLDAVKVGDQVSVAFYEAVAIGLQKPGEPKVEAERSAQPFAGSRPGGMMSERTTASVDVMAVDPRRSTVTVKTPTGDTRTLKVTDPKVQAGLDEIKPGERIQLTYTEAIAISVTPAQK